MELELATQNLENKNIFGNNSKVDLLVEKDVTVEKQNNFLESTLGKTINTAIDVGLRAVLPDMIEDQVIDVKDVLLKNGLKEGIDVAVKSAIDLGKSALGIITGKFDNLSQAYSAVKKGGIIDGVSETIDNVVESASKNKLISTGTSRLIKKGKNALLDTVTANIVDTFLKEMDSVEKVSKYISNWNNYYNLKDIDGMEKEYGKIKKQMQTMVALDSTISEAKKIENIHNLIKNKGENYVLSKEEEELAQILK